MEAIVLPPHHSNTSSPSLLLRMCDINTSAHTVKLYVAITADVVHDFIRSTAALVSCLIQILSQPRPDVSRLSIYISMIKVKLKVNK